MSAEDGGVFTFSPGIEDAGVRADVWLAKESGLSRAAVQRLLEEGAAERNGHALAKNDKIAPGGQITLTVPPPKPLEARAQNIPIEIVYEDDDLLVVNKPKGMVVHPAPGHPDGTLVNALLYACGGRLSGIGGALRPGIVHRIDKDTSGLLIVAKTDRAHLALAEQIAAHDFLREYEAVVCGIPKEPEGTIDAPIARDIKDRQKMCVAFDRGKEAVTRYRVLEPFTRHAYVSCRLFTGRTHQIRVHMKYIGCPVYGDGVYGRAEKDIEGQCLHARRIGFRHPVTGQDLFFESELPGYFEAVLDKLRAQAPRR